MGSQRVRHDWATSLSLFFHTLEKEMATHSSVLAWRIPGTGEPGGLQFMGLHRVGHDWSDLAAYIYIYIERERERERETETETNRNREWEKGRENCRTVHIKIYLQFFWIILHWIPATGCHSAASLSNSVVQSPASGSCCYHEAWVLMMRNCSCAYVKIVLA